MLKKFIDSNFSVETMPYVPTVLDTYSTSIAKSDRPINLHLFDTSGQMDYDHLRPNSYPDTVRWSNTFHSFLSLKKW